MFFAHLKSGPGGEGGLELGSATHRAKVGIGGRPGAWFALRFIPFVPLPYLSYTSRSVKRYAACRGVGGHLPKIPIRYGTAQGLRGGRETPKSVLETS